MEEKPTPPNQVDITTLSDFLIIYFMSIGNPITQLKLQKLAYYIHSWHLVYFNKNNPYAHNQIPQAWVNGPVYRAIYNTYAATKDTPLVIKDDTKTIEEMLDERVHNLGMTSDQLDLVNSVLNNYGHMNDASLVYLTHTEDPWLEARQGLPPFMRSEKPISEETMFNYYSHKLNK